MDAVEYIKEAKRICKSRNLCNSVSGKCPLLDENGHCTATVDIRAADIIDKTEKAVQIVEQWGKDHPVKTRQSEFLKMFPTVVMAHGVIALRPCRLDTRLDMKKDCLCSDLYSDCDECKMAYWLAEVTDNE